uniref:Uncharacterized protein n=1 Tax=Branchiostoma floridae TaxID=7739 RepID=C3Y5I9_BRAFL|eukprot:XP_002608226.1 hypothetical protein BRAFLDRAFT_87892 [Branchiostoma floridae]
MAQLMATLRGQVWQTTTRVQVSGHCRRLKYVTNRSMFTEENSQVQRSLVRRAAGHYNPGRSFCTEAAPATSARQARSRWWDRLTVVGPLSVALLGLWIDWRVRQVENRKEETRKKTETRRNQLAHVNNQLANLYGPLHGNRLATDMAYKKVLSKNRHTKMDYNDPEKEGLQTYLEDAKIEWQKKGWLERWWNDPSAPNRGRSMLTRWRRYLLYVIHPLDLQAEEIIRTNMHLVDNSDEKNAELFQKFLFHVNYQKFIVANWEDRGFVVAVLENYRDGDFDLWSNSGILEEDTAFLQEILPKLQTHVEQTYTKLVKRQQQLMEGLKMEDYENKNSV